MTIAFDADDDVENNTAIEVETQSDQTGNYLVELNPGSYVVNVDQEVNESGTTVTYQYSAKISISIGQAPKTYDLALTREE